MEARRFICDSGKARPVSEATTMSERAAELWERGQELDGSAEELWESIIERNKQLDWDREAIARELGLVPRRSDGRPSSKAER